jgi:glycosyltransferase involved in cell wall biosynthesis
MTFLQKWGVMTKSKPLVSITFPIHRNHQFAFEALTSILNQDYSNIEVLFLDNSQEGLKDQFDLSDNRVSYIRLPSWYGLAETLNYAIDNAQGSYLARMDYDDIALPNRISRQVNFMEENPKIAISGTNIEVIGESIDENVKPGQVVKRKLIHEELCESLMTNNAFFHPTVIFRINEIRRFGLKYRPICNSAEDLDLWLRASRFVILGNLDETLLKYRLHANQYSRLDGLTSNYIAKKVRLSHSIWLLKNRKINITLGLKLSLKLSMQIMKQLLEKRKSQFDKFKST